MLMGASRVPAGRMGLSRLGFIHGLGAAETAGGGATPFDSTTARTNTADPATVYYHLPADYNQPSPITAGMTVDQYYAKNMPGWYVSGKGFPYYKDYQGNPIAFNPNDPQNVSGWVNPNLTGYAFQAADATNTANDQFNYPYNTLLQTLSDAQGTFLTVERAVICNNFNIQTGTDCAFGPGGDITPTGQYAYFIVPGIDWTVPLINGSGKVDAHYNVPQLIPPDVAAAFGYPGGNVILQPAPCYTCPPLTPAEWATAVANIKATGSYQGNTTGQTSSPNPSSGAPIATSNADAYAAAMANYGTEQAAINAAAAATVPPASSVATSSAPAQTPTIPTAAPTSAADVATWDTGPAATTTSTSPGVAQMPASVANSGPAPLSPSQALQTTVAAAAPATTESTQGSVMDWISANPLLAAGIAAVALFAFTRD